MTDIPWDHQASLIRAAGAGEQLVRHGILHQLVSGFLELSPEGQSGLLIRASGPDWTCEFDEASIRELAARPDFTGAFGRDDSEREPDDLDLTEAEDETNLVEAGVSGPSAVEGEIGRLGSEEADQLK
jgi:hypothetical protein